MGPVLVLISAVCFGAMAIFGKYAYAAGVPTDVLLMLRFTIAAALMGAVLAVRPDLRNARVPRPTQPGRDHRAVIWTALGLGAIGYALQSSFYFSALTRIDASLTALVLYTFPIFVTVASALLGRERLTPRRGVALLAATVGTLLVLVGVGRVRFDLLGVALAFGAAITYTLYILISDTIVHRLPPVVLSTLVMAGAAATLGARAFLTGTVDLRLSPTAWLWIGCIAIVSTVVAMLTFFAGMARTGPSTASILSTFEPVVTTGLAAVTLHEFLTPVQVVGALLVLGAAVVVQLRSRNAPQVEKLLADAVRPGQ